MKIAHIHIHNFCSIRDLKLDVTEDFMVFLGPNNHGKSNMLRAIEFVLTPSAKVDKDNFFKFAENGDNTLWVEVVFVDLTDREKQRLSAYLLCNGSVKVRKTAKLRDDDNVDTEYHGYNEEPEEWWLKPDAKERLGSREAIQVEANTVLALQDLLRQYPTGRITANQIQAFQSAYIQEHREQLHFSEALRELTFSGKKTVPAGTFPDFYLVPAVRDLNDEIRTKNTSLLGRLLHRSVQEMTSNHSDVIGLQSTISGLFGKLNDRSGTGEEESQSSPLTRLEKGIIEELQDWEAKVAIELVTPDIATLFSDTRLHIDDGVQTLADRKGHGLQRAILFALLRVVAASLRADSGDDGDTSHAKQTVSESIIFAIEEPEMFLHPHAQRRLSRALHEIAGAQHYQVFITTHSTHFVDMDKYRSIAIINKTCSQTGTSVRQCTRELFEGESVKEKKDRLHMAAWVNPDRSEMFFARKVVFVEGETEQKIIPFLADKLGVFDPDVSIVDCGGKHNLPLYIKIANAFNLQYTVVHDEDPIPENCPEEKIASKQRTFQLNTDIQNIVDTQSGAYEMVEPDFEGVAGISYTQSEKKGKALAALEFFWDKHRDDIPEALANAVRRCFG
jgi:CRISPR-associated exonuclease Cas4